MKNIIVVIGVLSVFLLFIGCKNGGLDMINKKNMSDEEVARNTLDNLVEALENEDADALKNLFASNVVKGTDDFDESIEELFKYYNGDFKSCSEDGTVSVSSEVDDGVRKKEYDSSYDVVTSEDTYRIAIFEVISDTGDSGNVGIKSLYIIRKEDDTNASFVYHGDCEFTEGIHINVKNKVPELY